MFAKETYIGRRNSLRKSIKSGIVLLLGNGESPRNYPDNGYYFRQDSTFLYYFGLAVPDLVGVMDIDAATDCVYGNDFTIDDVIWMGDQPTVKTLAESAGVCSTGSLRELHNVVRFAIRNGRKIHFLVPYRPATVLLLEQLTGIRSCELKEYASMELTKGVVADREIKSSEEIAELDKAFNIGHEMHTLAMRMCSSGVSEREIAGAIEGIALCKGDGVSFHNIVTHNGQTLHNHYHGNRLAEGRLLLVDAGAESGMNYCSDNTRTMPVSRRFTSKQKDVYNVLVKAFETSLSAIKPKITYQSVHQMCANVLCEGLIDLGLMRGKAEDAARNGAFALFMPHGLGHQLGLDVHDMENLGENNVGYDQQTERSTQIGYSSLRMGKILRPGHVITVEPGIYFIPKLIEKWRNENINRSFIDYNKVEEYLDFGGMRVEDTVVVQNAGARILGNHRIPYTVEQIEEYMNK